VATASIETISEITEGKFWFQLYHPAETDLRDKLLDRAEAAGCEVLVILADTPTFAYRPKEIRNGLSMLKRQLQQFMEQVTCEKVRDFPNHLVG
jgi:L-lactate dehydrogenase (cytochrome)